MLRTEWLAPFGVSCPLQIWVTVWPLANVQLTVQPVEATGPLVTVTSAWKPPAHWLTTRYTAVHPPDPPPEGVVTDTVPDRVDRLPAASRAYTANEYTVDGVRPVSVALFVADVSTGVSVVPWTRTTS